MGDGGLGSTQANQQGLSTSQQDLAKQAASRSAALFDMSMPGMKTAENYYQSLASGNPTEIFKTIAPATEQLKAQNAGVKQNISDTMPRGGEQNLAKEMADINTSSNIGTLATKSYTGAPAALAQLGNQNIGLSTNQMANAISGYGSAGQTMSNVAQEQAAQKASQMGMLGSGMSTAGSLAGAFFA